MGSVGEDGSWSWNAQINQKNSTCNNHVSKQHLCMNDFMFGHQNFQSSKTQPELFSETTVYGSHNIAISSEPVIINSWKENTSGDSPTLTTNSERSEITEASVELNFPGGQQPLVGKPVHIPQPCQMQQSGYSDMQLLQQTMMFKQLQEIQRQQQLQQFGDPRQHISTNYLSEVTKQATGVQFTPLIKGIPVNDASKLFSSWVQRGVSPAPHGTSSRAVFSQDQAQSLRPMGRFPQTPDVSVHGNSMSGTRVNVNQNSYRQVMDSDSSDLLTKASAHSQEFPLQPSSFNDSLTGGCCLVSNDQVCSPQGDHVLEQGFQGKNDFGQIPNQGSSGTFMTGNLQQHGSVQATLFAMESNDRQERPGWSGGILRQKPEQLSPSQNLVPLDPTEKQLLYNMDDNTWDTIGLDRRTDVGAGGLGSMLEQNDHSNALSSIQSGSWSALMQSAVAEASSNDTGLQEEWSGLTFQNSELSNDNQPTNFMDSGRQQGNWADSNLQTSSSISSKPFPIFNDTSVSSEFPGFQQPSTRFLTESKFSQDGLPVQSSPRNTGWWSGSKPLQKDAVDEATFKAMDSGSYLMKEDANYGAGSSLVLSGGQEQVQSSSVNESRLNRRDVQTYDNPSMQKLSIINARSGISQPCTDDNQLIYGRNPEIPKDEKEFSSMRKMHHQISIGSGLHVLHNSSEESGKTYDKQQNCHQGENAYGMYGSSGLSNEELGYIGKPWFTGDASKSATRLNGGPFPDFQGSSNASEEISSENDAKIPAAFLGSINSSSQNVIYQGSQNKLELHRQVNQSRQDSSSPCLGSDGYNLPSDILGSPALSMTQVYHQHPSQDFSPRLIPGSSRLSASNVFPSHGLPQVAINLKSRLPNFDFGSQLSLRPSLQATATASKYSPFNHASKQEDSQQNVSNPHGQTFNVLEASPVLQPPAIKGGLQYGSGLSGRSHDGRESVPIQQHVSGAGSNVISSRNVSNIYAETSSSAMRGLNNQNNRGSSKLGIYLENSQGYENRDGRPGEHSSRQQISLQILDASYKGDQKDDSNAFASDSTLGCLQHQDFDRLEHRDKNSVSASGRHNDSFNHAPLHPFNVFHQKYSAHLAQAMKNVEANSNKKVLHVQQAPAWAKHPSMNEENLGFKNPMDKTGKSSSHADLLPSIDTPVESSSAEGREDPRASLQPTIKHIHSEVLVGSGKNDAEKQPKSNGLLWNHAECSRVNLSVTPLWFGTPSDGLHTSPFKQIDSDVATQSGRNFPENAATLLQSRPFPPTRVLSPDVTDQSMAVVPKKRKIAASEPLTWYKEVRQDSGKVQSISISEREWAQATHRLIEKVDELEMIERGQPIQRAKRRLVLTTQLMQQLFCPPPGAILSEDSSLNYDSLVYFVAKLSLGDSCCLTYSPGNKLWLPPNTMNEGERNAKAVRSFHDQSLSGVAEGLVARVKKLENDLPRLDNASSLSDVRVDCQELEKVSVINRFAKFHVRQAADASSSKTCPQRYVTAHPMPQNLPDGQQCLSL